MKWKRAVLAVGIVAAVVAVGTAAAKMIDPKLPPAPQVTPALIEEGRYLAIAGDCAACHTRIGGPVMAGGFRLNTPFGAIYAPNITPDKETGLGDWSREDFIRAMRRGLNEHHNNLYPAFPYPYYAKVTTKDLDAIWAYLKSQPAVSYESPKNELPFPFNIRLAVTGWNWLHFRSAEYKPDPKQSAEWNRGAYLFDGLGHCAACHSPRNAIGGEKSGQKVRGGEIDGFWAPDLTGNKVTGLGNWSKEEIAQFLKTGTNAHSQVYGSMTEVVQNSTSQMTDADLMAMAVYMKSLAPSPAVTAVKADAAALAAGKPLYDANCAACHLPDGSGVPSLYPPLKANAGVNAPNVASLTHIVVGGNKMGPHVTIKGIDPMPSFGEKLKDDEIAKILTYVRGSFGNTAGPVAAADVAKARKIVAERKAHEPPALAAPPAPPAGATEPVLPAQAAPIAAPPVPG